MTMKDYLQQVLLDALRQFDGVPAGFMPELEAPRAAHFGDLPPTAP